VSGSAGCVNTLSHLTTTKLRSNLIMATKHSSGDLHSRIYKKLRSVVPDLLTIEEHGKSKVPGLMDLNMDVLHRTPSKIVIALSHYYKHPSGDMIADPDMEIAVYPDRDAAEALTYQDTYGYRVVYHDGNRVDLRAKKELNAFLHQWLGNLIAQGHRIRPPDLLAAQGSVACDQAVGGHANE
jgi:hypothetical protein